MSVSRKTNKKQYRRKSYRQNNNMIGRGNLSNDQLLLVINAVSRTLLETNENLVDFVDNFLVDNIDVLKIEDKYNSYVKIDNYLENNLAEIENKLFEYYDMTSEFFNSTADVDQKTSVKCLFYLCLYNHIETGLRHFRPEVAVGGRPGNKRRMARDGIQAVATAGCGYAGMVIAGAQGAACAQGAAGILVAVCGYPVMALGGLVGAVGGFKVSRLLFDGIYTAVTTGSRVLVRIGGEMYNTFLQERRIFRDHLE